MKKSLLTAAITGVLLLGGSFTVAVDTANAGVVNLARPGQGQLGQVKVNPYGYAPLTAIIRFGSKHPSEVTDVTVNVRGKDKKGVPIKYDVSKEMLQTHDGIPVFGLYGNYENLVDVTYKLDGKSTKETYKIMTQPVVGVSSDGAVYPFPQVTPKKVDAKFSDRLYWINHLVFGIDNQNMMWSNGGALEWDRWPINFITDTQGDVRWYLDHNRMHDLYDIRKRGIIMGVHQVENGDIIFGQGQRYYRMDLMGRMIVERDLPTGYSDFSHAMKELPNGNYLLRAAKRNYPRDDGAVVTTVRDHILEIDPNGRLVDVWDLNKILDPLRDALLTQLDAKAVCLNVDENAEDVKIEPDAPFGDHAGVGAGRNWAHVNSIDYDPSDDSIIISARHQGVVKIGRDKEVKWILSPREGWRGELAKKVLTPVDENGNKLNCTEKGKCSDTDFDFSYTQHTAWLIPEKGTLSVFDNGDGRHYEQPAFEAEKYSRAVEYKIDDKNMTVQQVWEFGKEKGHDWYSPITSVVEYEKDKNSMMVYFASSKLLTDEVTNPHLVELKYGTDDVMVDLDIKATTPKQTSYRSVIIRPEQAFNSK